MKLYEIIRRKDFDQKRQEPEDAEAFAAVKRLFKGDVGEVRKFGHGEFAYVFSPVDEHNVNTVKKVSRQAMTDDEIEDNAYLKYLASIIRSGEMKKNPYLPKIYNIRFFSHAHPKKEDEKSYQYEVELERLRPLYELLDDQGQGYSAFDWDENEDDPQQSHNKQIAAMGKRMFNNFSRYLKISHGFPVDALSELLTFFTSDSKKLKRTKGYGEIFTELEENIRKADVSVKDKRLRTAIAHIKNAMQAGNISFSDLKPENMMLRITSIGPQLVITDPVRDFSRSKGPARSQKISRQSSGYTTRTTTTPSDDEYPDYQTAKMRNTNRRFAQGTQFDRDFRKNDDER